MTFAELSKMVTPELLETMTTDEQAQLFEQLQALRHYERYHRIELFEPFEYQRKFMAAGKQFKTRYLRAGNRVGKTYGAATEFSYHLTGLYPDWWEGLTVPSSGHTYWCVGVSLDSVAKVLQKELFGTPDCRIDSELGTGSLPLHTIEKKLGWKQDGGRLLEVRIRHKDGGLNTLMFYGSENESTMMGQRVAGCMMDEEAPYNSLKIFSQIQTRLLNALGEGENGFMLFTATPEQGQTKLNDLFDKNESGVLYMQSASIYDNPTYTEEQIKQFLAGVPDYQRDMRLHGIPVLGTGAVFRVDDVAIMVENIQPLPHWQIVGGVDWGLTQDATVLVFAVYDPDNDNYYIFKEYYFGGSADTGNRTAQHLANVILNSEFASVPIIMPHDGVSRGKIMRDMGCNIPNQPFFNPQDTQLDLIKTTNSKSNRLIGTGIDEMILLFEQERLKVDASCFNWFREKRNYFWQYNEVTGEHKAKGQDHTIDASRYALLSLIGNRGCEYSERLGSLYHDADYYQTVTFNQG